MKKKFFSLFLGLFLMFSVHSLYAADFVAGFVGRFGASSATTDRSKIFYNAVPGEFYEVTHILIPITKEQTADVTEIENDPYLTQEEKDTAIANIKSIEKTKVTQKLMDMRLM